MPITYETRQPSLTFDESVTLYPAALTRSMLDQGRNS
jgi:hypothetical protein